MAKVVQKKKEYKVIKTFRDKNTLELYEIGDIYEANEKRAKELKGYIDEKPSK